jgi:uncharacterized protein (TIGR02145 family)
MRKIVTLILAVLLTASLWAQAPQKFSYQAVIRNASSALVANQKVGIQISILQTSATGVVVYTERHEPTTNSNGLATLEIGGGTVMSGDFTKIDWAKGPFYVRTEADPTGGTNYTISGESQLLSVPYALYALNGQPGPKGEPGQAGKDGMNGVDGKDGAQGPQGIQGPKGDKGEPGIQGPQGIQGSKGDKGDTGLTGPAGKDGAQGPQGIQGPKGDKGDTGLTGPAGKDGAQGPQGIQGSKGDKGDTGLTGPAAKDGAQGPQGIQGPKGDKGDTGLTGPAGKDGAQGPQGPKGDTPQVKVSVSLSGDTLKFENGNYVIIPGISAANPIKNNTSGNTVTDIDGNTYKTVVIGTQTWMAENLRVSKYNNGDLITFVSDSSQWSARAYDAWCYPNNDEKNNIPYGKLYNLYAVVDSRKLCPSGWHVSTDAEWTTLTNFLGGESVAGGKLKSVGTLHWRSPNPGATDEFGFSIVGAAARDHDATIIPFKETAYFWTPTLLPNSTTQYYGRVLGYNSAEISRYNNGYPASTGFSIRCVKDADNTNNQPIQGSIQSIDCGGATNNGTLTANSPANGVSSLIVYTGGNGGSFNAQTINSTGVTGLTATLSAGSLANGNGTLTYTLSGTPASSGTATFEINIGGKTCAISRTIVQPTSGYGPNIIDVDGNTYKTVYIGTQQWMGENLKTSKYNDGTTIPKIVDQTEWKNHSIGAWCYNENDSLKYNKVYGKLYNWYVFENNKNICPTGWRIPSNLDWKKLADYLGGETIAGLKMKEVWTTHWSSTSVNVTNESLFTGLPGGHRHPTGFEGYGGYGKFWTSTEINQGFSNAVELRFNGDALYLEQSYQKILGISVRCIKD